MPFFSPLWQLYCFHRRADLPRQTGNPIDNISARASVFMLSRARFQIETKTNRDRGNIQAKRVRSWTEAPLKDSPETNKLTLCTCRVDISPDKRGMTVRMRTAAGAARNTSHKSGLAFVSWRFRCYLWVGKHVRNPRPAVSSTLLTSESRASLSSSAAGSVTANPRIFLS